MKKLTNIDARLLPITGEGEPKYKEDAPGMVTIREVLRMIGNAKADTADDSRRTRRLIIKLKDKTSADLLLENDDLAFVQKVIERNAINLTAWAQGQMLDFVESAEKVEAPKV